jgi:hypothetical protein
MLCEAEEGDGMSGIFHYNFHTTKNKKTSTFKINIMTFISRSKTASSYLLTNKTLVRCIIWA